MVNSCKLYFMISSTDTRVGQLIRLFTRYDYNHVALSLDPTFRNWVAFGRYNYDAPFYAGLVSEPVERYLAKGEDIAVRIFAVDITPDRYERLQQLFSLADRYDSGLIYNHFAAWATPIRWQVNIPGAYTCLSFACRVLEQSHPTIKRLNRAMQPYLIYDGLLSDLVSDSGNRSALYFNKLGLWRGTGRAARQIARLSYRAVRRRKVVDMVSRQLDS